MLNQKERVTLNVLKTLDETNKTLGILKCLSKYCPCKNKEMSALIGVLFEKIHTIRKKQRETAEILDKEINKELC